MQQFLKPAARVAGTGVVPAQFLDQFLVAVDDAVSTFDLGFGWIAFAAFTGGLESRNDPAA
jgi:hypothetical protein